MCMMSIIQQTKAIRQEAIFEAMLTNIYVAMWRH